jgi:hypothetical protein
MQENRNFKGVWIDKEIWLDTELTWMEKLFLTEINSLDNESGCFASNKYFAEFFNLSDGRCSQIINSLIKKKYLSVRYVYRENSKEIEKRVLNILNTRIKNIKRGYLENAEDSNTIYNNTKDNSPKTKGSPLFKQTVDLIYKEYEDFHKEKLIITAKEASQIKHIIKNANNDFTLITKKIKVLKKKCKQDSWYTMTPGKLLSEWNNLVDLSSTDHIKELQPIGQEHAY